MTGCLTLAGCGGGGQDPATSRFDYPSALDSAFGSGGYLVESTGLDEKVFLSGFGTTDFMVDDAGRLVVIGTRASSTREAWIFRMLPDGTADPSCGNGGWASFSTGGPATPLTVRQLPDGRYVLGGNLGSPSLWVLRGDCSIDETFGTSGMAAMPASSPTEIQAGVNAIDVDARGRIVATVGSTLSGNVLVARFTAAGALDPSFGHGGYTSIVAPDGGAPRPAAVRVRPDGRVLIAASMDYNSQVGEWAGFLQLEDNGALDASFGTGGFVSVRPRPNYVAIPKDLVLLPDGSAVQAGLTQPGVLAGTVIDVDAYWLRVDAAGNAAPAFGGSGLITWSAGPLGRAESDNYATSLLLDSPGSLWSCQNWVNNTKQSSQIEAAAVQAIVQRRAATDGQLDESFGAGGTAWLPRAGDLAASCIALRRAPDGSVLALLDYGPPELATGEAFAVVRVAQ